MSLLFSRPDWFNDAACRGADQRIFFPDRGESITAAKTICESCPVTAECLQYAINLGIKDGVWGGVGETKRRRQYQPNRTIVCHICDTPFVVDRSQPGTRRYCSEGCRVEARRRVWNEANLRAGRGAA